MNRKPRSYTYAAIALVALGAGLRLIGLARSVWMDEFSSIEVAVLSPHVIQSLRAYDHPPAYYLLLKLWSALGTGDVFLRVPSVVLGVLTIVAMMKWLKTSSRAASLFAGLLCATLPILLRYSQEIRDYSLLMLSTTAAFYCASRILDGAGAAWYRGLAATLSVAVATHLVGVVVIPSVGVYLLPGIVRRETRIHRGGLLAALAVPVVVFALVYFAFMERDGRGEWWMPPVSASLVVSTFRYVLGIDMLWAPGKILRDYSPVLSVAYRLAVTFGLVGCVLFTVMPGNWRNAWPLLASAVWYWLSIAVISILAVPIFWYRTCIPGLIPLIGFLAIQVSATRGRLRALATANVAAICLLMVAGWVVAEARFPEEPWKEIARSLKAEYRPGDRVAFYPPYVAGPVRYYFPALPLESTQLVRSNADVHRMRVALEGDPPVPKGVVAPALFLIARHGLPLQAGEATYGDICASLDSVAESSLPPRSFGNASLQRFELHP
jgi:hypothetical protein